MAKRSWDDQKLIEALEERAREHQQAAASWYQLFYQAIDLLTDARPYVEHEVEHAGAKPDSDLLEAMDILLKAASTTQPTPHTTDQPERKST